MLTLYIISKNTETWALGNRIFIKKDENIQEYALRYVSAVYIGPETLLHTNLIMALSNAEIPIYFCRDQGFIYASTYSPRYGQGVYTTAAQLRLSLTPKAKAYACEWLLQKYIGRLSVLKDTESTMNLVQKNRLIKLNILHEKIKKSPTAINLEGVFDKQYWKIYFGEFPLTYHKIGRVKRNAVDPINLSLNYAYGILYHLVERLAIKNNLDPYIGFNHGMAKGNKAFVYDTIEGFRPWVEELVYRHQKALITMVPEENGKMSIEHRKLIADIFNEYIYMGFLNRKKRIKIIEDFFKETAKNIKNEKITLPTYV